MRVYANGVPKSGNHALVRVLELLGVTSDVNHTKFADGLPDNVTHHIFIKREPRNIIVSQARFTNKDLKPENLIDCWRNFYGGTIFTEMDKYQDWLTDKKTMVVSFEEMTTDGGETIKRIAEFCNVPYHEEVYKTFWGHTFTWTGKLSNYKDYWNEKVQAKWEAEGGKELLFIWGYK